MKKSTIASSILKRALSTYIFDKKDQKQHKIFFGLLPLQELFAKLLKEIASPRSGGVRPGEADLNMMSSRGDLSTVINTVSSTNLGLKFYNSDYIQNR